jgi:hypothetical protein
MKNAIDIGEKTDRPHLLMIERKTMPMIIIYNCFALYANDIFRWWCATKRHFSPGERSSRLGLLVFRYSFNHQYSTSRSHIITVKTLMEKASGLRTGQLSFSHTRPKNARELGQGELHKRHYFSSWQVSSTALCFLPP